MAPEPSYAAYLSFSETGNIGQTFVSHLHGALKQEGIYTFKDDRNQDRGISFSKDSSRAIEESQIIVVVFCENFVLSKDCLDEVVKIMDCRKLLKKIVIPIFYDVEPSEVRRQRNNLAEAFADDSENDDEIGRSERVKRWRDALNEAGNISGFDLRKTHDGNEAECIEHIVKEIVSKLRSEEVAGERQKYVEFGSKFLSERVIGFTRSAASPFPLCVPVFFFVTIYII
ncbi:PREDICTED: TMV resistance protein N-like [Nicotiana attenuata]|uniref:Tmv resistance protein n n=1 Tax=Nicotiana attenuata TaxID=49451 RepID=A0A1J6IHK2_NICAT|nr:PREDICTED: TMV resistance protein N-like [Nicotiana attenuata]OIT04549.1 tmv resistance protein n [Nicotiana attenuata]